MSSLVLELRAGDMMVVNGAAIRFRGKTRIELTAHARFLFGRQIMPPNEADSPARRIYFALQTAYIGEEDERRAGLAEACVRVDEFKGATTSAQAAALLDQAIALAKAGKCYLALRMARRVMQHEDAVLGRPRRGAARHQISRDQSSPTVRSGDQTSGDQNAHDQNAHDQNSHDQNSREQR
jgi:flagellar protein FlbT